MSDSGVNYVVEQGPFRYRVNEVFYSVQGEGFHAGRAAVFLRFSGCNLTCRREHEGFDCDTEFSSGATVKAEEVVIACEAVLPPGERVPEGTWLICTGGEPTLQLDMGLCQALREAGFSIAVETNGTRAVPIGVDWVSCSPKTAEHTLAVGSVDELRYVRHVGQAIPRPSIAAVHKYVSPAWSDDPAAVRANIAWCIGLVKANPEWRLSCQQHKWWGVR